MTGRLFVPAAGKDWLLPIYDPFTKLLGVERFHRCLLEQAVIPPRSRVLEVGCGTGNLAILAKRLHPTAEVVGIDPDPKALARARRKAQRAGVLVHFELAYSEQLPFPDASFDRVLSAFMLHHLDSRAKVPALREARRVLKASGALHLADFSDGHAHGLHGLLARLVHARHGATTRSLVLDLMRTAGLANPQEVAGQASVLGRVVYYRAARPPSPAPAAV